MRFLFAFVGLVAVAAAAHTGTGKFEKVVPELFQGNHEYVYNYRSVVGTGFPRQSGRYAGLEKYGVLTVQVQEQQGDSKTVAFRLGHVASGSFDQEVEDFEYRRVEGVTHTPEETFEKYGPVFVRYHGNVVEKFDAPEAMPEEVVNVYRGVAAAFTVGNPEPTHEGEHHPFAFAEGGHGHGHGKAVVYRRHEHGLTGNFETTYEVLSNPEHNQHHHHLNVTKTRNYLKHVGRDGRYFHNGHDERGCHAVCPTHKPVKVEGNMKPDFTAWNKPYAEGCPVEFHPKTELVEAFTTYNYNMTVEQNGGWALVHEVQAIDRKALPLRQQKLVTVSALKLTLTEQRPVSQVWEKTHATKHYEDLLYRFPEGHKFDLPYLALYNKQNTGDLVKDQVVPMLKALTNTIVSENIELRSQTGDKVVQLTQALGVLGKHELKAVWAVVGQTAAAKSGTDFDKVLRKVFVDTVALTGSNDAAEFLLDLVQQQQLTTIETVDTLQAFQKNLVRPTTTVLTHLQNICTDAKFHEKRVVFTTACVTFAEAVRTNCGETNTHHWQKWQKSERTGEHGHFCGEQEYKQYVDAVRGHLTSATTFAEQTVYIQTLGRLSHPEALKTLVPYVFGEAEVVSQVEKTHDAKDENTSEYVNFLRQVALYSLHHSTGEHAATVEPLVQAVYFNKQEPYELRVAALSVLLATHPTESTFGRIVVEVAREENEDVAAFTYSALYNLANSTLPCMRQSARRVQNVLGALPPKTFGYHHSNWHTYSSYLPTANLGYKGHWEVVHSNVSYVPRSFYYGFTANKGPFVSTVFDFGMIAKGFHNLDQYVQKQGGMARVIDNVVQRIRRSARTLAGEETVEKMLNNLEQTLQFNHHQTDEQPRAVFYGNVLGHEAFLPVDKHYIAQLTKEVGETVVKYFRDDVSQQTFRYVRVVMPRTYVQVAPGVNGLPVVLTNHHPVVFTVSLKDLTTRFGVEGAQMKQAPYVFAASGVFRPTVYHTSVHTAMVVDPVAHTRFAYGFRTYEQTYATFPVDVAVQYTNPTKTFAFTFRPRFEKVFFHKSRAMTFKTENDLIRPVDKAVLDHYTILRVQQQPKEYERVIGEKLGMALRVQGIYVDDKYLTEMFGGRFDGYQSFFTRYLRAFFNEWFLPQTWAVRFEQPEHGPVQEIKMIFRLGNLYNERAHNKEHNVEKMAEKTHLTQEQQTKEQAYPEAMRMIAYEQEYEKIVGRKPQPEKMEQAVERLAKQTEKYWSTVDPELRTKLTKETAQVRSIEYIIAAKGQKKPITVTGHIVLASAPGHQANVAELTMNGHGVPCSLKAQIVSAYTKAPQPFETELPEEEQRGVIGFTAQLETPRTGKQQYTGKIEMTKSEEQKHLMKTPVEHKPWFYRQCQQDKKTGTAEVSTACQATRYHKAALDKLRFEIELPEMIPAVLINATHKTREAMKATLRTHLHAQYDVETTKPNKIEGEIVYYPYEQEMRMANLTLRTPDQQQLFFERIPLPKMIRQNTMWTTGSKCMFQTRQGESGPTCFYNGHYVRTFDNVTVSLDSLHEGEKVVVTRDNSAYSKFTVTATKTGSGPKPTTFVEFVLRNVTYVQLKPTETQGHYTVVVNGTETTVTPAETKVAHYGPGARNVFSFHVEEHKNGHDTLVFHVRDLGLYFVYDGHFFKVTFTTTAFKGHLAGLCGNMNFEYSDELTGPRGCRFEHEADFVRSYGLTQKMTPVQGPWTCPEGTYPRGASQEQIAQHREHKMALEQHKQLAINMRNTFRAETEHVVEETKVLTVGDKVCYSVEQLPTCEEGYRPVNTERRNVAFTCMPADHPHTLQIQREIQLRGTSAMPTQYNRPEAVVYHEVEVAHRCAH